MTLANLLNEDHDVTLVELDEAVSKDVANKTQALVIHGDGCDISVLSEAGIAEADAVIATSEDKVNLMICQIAKSENVKKIISLIREPKNGELFTKLGITNLVSVVSTNVIEIKRMLYQVGEARIIAQLGQGEMQIVEMTLAEGSKLIGKPAQLTNATLAAIYRGGELLIPTESMKLESGDLVLIVAHTKDLPALIDLIEGK